MRPFISPVFVNRHPWRNSCGEVCHVTCAIEYIFIDQFYVYFTNKTNTTETIKKRRLQKQTYPRKGFISVNQVFVREQFKAHSNFA